MSTETTTETAGASEAQAPMPATPETTPTPATQEPTPQAADIENQQAETTQTETTQSETAAKMVNEYALDAGDEEASDTQEQGAEEGKGDDAPYALEFSEGTTIDEGLVGIATRHFKEMGADGKKAGACMERIIAEYQEAQLASMEKDDGELKQDWGENYAANKKAVRAGLKSLLQGAGLEMSDGAVFESPKGYRLAFKILKRAGLIDEPAAGVTRGAGSEGKSWADAAMRDSTHPDFAALHDMNHPRHAEVSARYKQIKFGA